MNRLVEVAEQFIQCHEAHVEAAREYYAVAKEYGNSEVVKRYLKAQEKLEKSLALLNSLEIDAEAVIKKGGAVAVGSKVVVVDKYGDVSIVANRSE